MWKRRRRVESKSDFEDYVSIIENYFDGLSEEDSQSFFGEIMFEIAKYSE